MNMKKKDLIDNKISNVHKNVIETLSKITKIDQSGINEETLIREELGIDSLLAMEILAKIEKFYNITINEEDAIKRKTVGEFIDLIIQLIHE
jgi:acyl carrier protein